MLPESPILINRNKIIASGLPLAVLSLKKRFPGIFGPPYTGFCNRTEANTALDLMMQLGGLRHDVVSLYKKNGYVPPSNILHPTKLLHGIPLRYPNDHGGFSSTNEKVDVLMRHLHGPQIGLVLSPPYTGLLVATAYQYPSQGVFVGRTWERKPLTQPQIPPLTPISTSGKPKKAWLDLEEDIKELIYDRYKKTSKGFATTTELLTHLLTEHDIPLYSENMLEVDMTTKS